MESTTSVSKGVFLFKNSFKREKVYLKRRCQNLFDKVFIEAPWYPTFKSNWNNVERQLQDFHNKTYNTLLNDIVNYVKTFYTGSLVDSDGIIPSATLLTGVNQPDHESQFIALLERIRDEVTPHVSMVQSQDALTVKHLVENVVWQLCHEYNEYNTSDEEQLNLSPKKNKLKKSNCTMKTLKRWYRSMYASPKKKNSLANSLVIILPDFESFNCNVLQDFIMILSSYVPSLPIFIVFGVATSVSALHKSFPYHVSSKLLIKVFHSHSSPVYMNQVLENVFLTHTSPFQLSGKAFELLIDVFLFYDFSVTGLVHSIKYCMMEHYYGDNIKTLCCEPENLKTAISNLSSDDLENVRRLLSFRPFVEAQDCKTRIALFEDDDFFRETLLREMTKLHEYLYSYYICIRVLAVFVTDLPRNVIGKTVREIYTICAAENIIDAQAFRECMQLINFQSQVKLVENTKAALKIINSGLVDMPIKPLRSTPTKNNINIITLESDFGKKFVKSVRVYLMMFLRQIEEAKTEATVLTDQADDSENVFDSRHKLKEKLLKATRGDRVQSEFEMVRGRFVHYLEEMFAKGLQPPNSQPFHEILFFSDVSSVKKVIIGAPRGAIHTALSNPGNYLQCTCCSLVQPESVTASLPDVCVAYKLHRECGRLINLYDWLQAFAAVLRPDQEHTVEPEIQMRFTRAVAELQFLGFIKSSKRKTDHVMRLTW